MPKNAKAFSPAGISSFFQVCDREPDGKLIKDPERVGARGGGFALKRGVITEVNTIKSKKRSIQVYINGKLAPEAETTRMVVNMLLNKMERPYRVTVNHIVNVPIGAGFGASGAGALSSALAVSKTLDLHLTYNELGRIAHVAEVLCQTGLGTVEGLMIGGCVVILEPGAAGYGLVDRIPISADYQIVAGVFEPRLTKNFLDKTDKRELLDIWGRKTLRAILTEPSVRNFMQACRIFAEKTGLTTERVQKLIDAAKDGGAVGACQNMLGEAVHALVNKEKVEKVTKIFQRYLPKEKITVAEVCMHGAYLIQ